MSNEEEKLFKKVYENLEKVIENHNKLYCQKQDTKNIIIDIANQTKVLYSFLKDGTNLNKDKYNNILKRIEMKLLSDVASVLSYNIHSEEYNIVKNLIKEKLKLSSYAFI